MAMTTTLDTRWVRYAKNLAEQVDGKYRVCAIALDKRGRLIAHGVNSYSQTHPRQSELARLSGNPHKQYLHAEIACLVKCRRTPVKLMVVRIDRQGNICMARPCRICNQAISEAGIKTVEYTIG